MKQLLVALLMVSAFGGSAAHAARGEEHALIAYMRVKPGTQKTFLKAAEAVIEASRSERGNLIYELHQSVVDPQQFVFYELFKSNADLQYHRNARHTKSFLRETAPIVMENGFVLQEYKLKSDRE